VKELLDVTEKLDLAMIMEIRTQAQEAASAYNSSTDIITQTSYAS